MGTLIYKRLHKEQGLCTSCSEPAHPGLTRCLQHNYTNATNNRAWHQRNKDRLIKGWRKEKARRKDSGCCTMCGGELDPDADSGKTNCMNCRSAKFRGENQCK